MQKQPFTELLIWQKGIDLTNFVYELSGKFPKDELYGLISQSRRASISIPANIAEGSQRTTSKEFAHFLLIAKGSLAELYTLLYIAKRRNYVDESQSKLVFAKVDELSKMIFSFYKKLITVHS